MSSGHHHYSTATSYPLYLPQSSIFINTYRKNNYLPFQTCISSYIFFDYLEGTFLNNTQILKNTFLKFNQNKSKNADLVEQQKQCKHTLGYSKFTNHIDNQIQKTLQGRNIFPEIPRLGQSIIAQKISHSENENTHSNGTLQKQENQRKRNNDNDCLGCRLVGCATMFTVSGYLFLQSQSSSNRNPAKHRTFLLVSSGCFAILGVGRAFL